MLPPAWILLPLGEKDAVFVQKAGPAATQHQLRFHQTASA
jgi:hypothetical protein